MTLFEAQLRKGRQEQARKVLFAGRLPATTARGRWHLLDLAVEHIGAETPVVLLEFGVAKGASMSYLTKKFTSEKSRFFGFDSFEGLPEDWTPGQTIAKGTFSTGGVPPEINDSRVRFIKGWFQNTVLGFLRGAHFTSTPLIHFDSDLYSSTLFLLFVLWQHFPKYFFIMDDFAFDECVALHDFLSAFPTEIEWLAKRTNDHGTPVQVFGEMRRTEFSVR